MKLSERVNQIEDNERRWDWFIDDIVCVIENETDEPAGPRCGYGFNEGIYERLVGEFHLQTNCMYSLRLIEDILEIAANHISSGWSESHPYSLSKDGRREISAYLKNKKVELLKCATV